MKKPIKFVVHHGGQMNLAVEGPPYVGGQVVEVEIMKHGLSYSLMKTICTRELDYISIKRMFFLTPGNTMSDGVKLICDDSDVSKVKQDSNLGVVTLFIEGRRENSFMGNNEEDVMD
ncbi:hypothetical protein LINGRAHAP2_LOCUS31775 [Linum grandiflorum]